MSDAPPSKPRLRLLLDHFAAIEDGRAAWRVMYPLREVLFLVVCASICSCDDYEDIIDWGEARLGFPRRYLDFHWGAPCVDWLRTLMNRVDPELFSACFMAWAAGCWPERPDLLALDGKTSRGNHDRKAGQAPLHLVSAFATNTRLVLGQEANVTCPTLVISNTADLACTPSHAARLFEALASEDKTFVEVKDADHYYIERYDLLPEAVKAVTGWLDARGFGPAA
jgi:pimeloyl-ACP methyl ester carboxylesterase